MIEAGVIHDVYPGVSITDIDGARTRGGGYDAVLSVCPCDLDPDAIHNMYPLADGPAPDGIGSANGSYETFATAVNRLRSHVRVEYDTLVHCHAGVSRAPSVTAAAIGAEEAITVYEALGRIKAVRERVRPHDRLRGYAKRYVESAHPTIDHRPFIDSQ